MSASDATSSRAMWDQRYASAAASVSTVWSLEPNAFIAAEVADHPPAIAIDLACGEGRNALWLAQRGWWVTAVDFSAVGIAAGRARAAQLGLDVTWEVADVGSFAPGTLVDLVVVAYLQLPSAALAGVVARAAGWLALGGRIVLVGHDADNLEHGVGGPQDARLLHDLEALRASASALHIERCERVLRRVGDSDAIDAVLVARRS